MQITDVRLKRVNSEKMKAVASVTFDGCFVVHDIKVIDPADKPAFIAMPSRKIPKGEFKDVAHPLNTETRMMIANAVLEKYEQADEPVSEEE